MLPKRVVENIVIIVCNNEVNPMYGAFVRYINVYLSCMYTTCITQLQDINNQTYIV